MGFRKSPFQLFLPDLPIVTLQVLNPTYMLGGKKDNKYKVEQDKTVGGTGEHKPLALTGTPWIRWCRMSQDNKNTNLWQFRRSTDTTDEHKATRVDHQPWV